MYSSSLPAPPRTIRRLSAAAFLDYFFPIHAFELKSILA